MHRSVRTNEPTDCSGYLKVRMRFRTVEELMTRLNCLPTDTPVLIERYDDIPGRQNLEAFRYNEAAEI